MPNDKVDGGGERQDQAASSERPRCRKSHLVIGVRRAWHGMHRDQQGTTQEIKKNQGAPAMAGVSGAHSATGVRGDKMVMGEDLGRWRRREREVCEREGG